MSKKFQDQISGNAARNEHSSQLKQFETIIKGIFELSEADYKLILPLLKLVKVKKQDSLLELGETYRNAYFLSKGFFRMYYIDLEGNEVNCRFSEQGSFVGDYQSILTQQPSRYCLKAMTDSELLSVNVIELSKLYDQSHAWERFGRLMAENIFMELRERMEMFLFFTPKERYAQLLNNSPELFHQVSQFHIASYLGIKPESLSRLKKRLSTK